MGNSLIRSLPNQDMELVRRLSLRWLRAATPHNIWAKKAKLCTEFLEGEQWSEADRAVMREQKRATLTLNMIAPLFRLVQGYQSSNRLDTNFIPTSDSLSSEEVANVLKAMDKAEAGRTDLIYTDSEVFADGLSSGRGFWDYRLCFKDNDFGEIAPTASDPFNTYIDPDCNTYDLNDSAAYIQESVWTDIDRINELYGPRAAIECEALTTTTHNSSLLSFLGESDVSPTRYFGDYADDKAMGNWADVYHTDFMDRQAKRLRLLDSQYKITSIAPCFIDLETGTKKAIPEEWMKPENQYMIQAALDYALMHDNPLKIAHRPVERIRWTVTCADVVLHDAWSPYSTYTKVGFFPYFRRGKTRGMIEDLIDPQREKNKKRSVTSDILNRNGNSGWMYEENSLDPEQAENLRRFGSSPGITIKWKAGANGTKLPPSRIEPGGYPQGFDRLEEKADIDFHQISGINESALGQLDRVQSGRAIEARQRQAVLAIQPYQDNFSRSKKLGGRKRLEIYQNHYTEERVYRILGEDSKAVMYAINQKQITGQNAVTRLNDITLGKYSVEIDEVPISATFKQGQFEEMMGLLEKLGPIGMLLAQSRPDLIIDQTTLPNKDEWKKGLMASASAAAMGGGAPPPAGGGAPAMAPTTPEQVAS